MTHQAMTHSAIDAVRRLESVVESVDQVDIETTHSLHAGVYCRSMTLPAGTVLVGALIKIPTTLIVSGDVTVQMGDEPVRLTGYQVIEAGAGQKRAFLTHQDTNLTMLFATDAMTVDEAEEQFTDEADRLMTRRCKA